jgi:hypothetical protein
MAGALSEAILMTVAEWREGRGIGQQSHRTGGHPKKQPFEFEMSEMSTTQGKAWPLADAVLIPLPRLLINKWNQLR